LTQHPDVAKAAGAVEMLYRWGEDHQQALDELEANMASGDATADASDIEGDA